MQLKGDATASYGRNRKLSLSLSMQSGCSQKGGAGGFFGTMEDPRSDLRAGVFDVSIASASISADAGTTNRLQMSRSSNQGSIGDELRLTELRINQFLENERVRPVMLQDYLKALGVFEENQKCQFSFKNRGHCNNSNGNGNKINISNSK